VDGLLDAAAAEERDREFEAALADYGRVAGEFAASQDEQVRVRVAFAMSARARVLGVLGRFDAQLAALEELLLRFRDAGDLPIAALLDVARLDKAGVLERLGRYSEALEVLDSGSGFDSPLPLLGARVDEARLLLTLGRPEEALTVCDALSADAPEGGAGLLMAGLAYRARALHELDRYEECVTAVDRLVDLVDRSDAPVDRTAAEALWQRASALARLARIAESVEACDEVIARFGDWSDADVLRFVAVAMAQKAGNLEGMRRFDEAISVHRELLARFDNASSAKLRGRAGESLLAAGNLLAQTRATRTLMSELESTSDGVDLALAARALVAVQERLIIAGELADAVAVADRVLDAIADRDERTFRKIASLAMAAKAVGLQRLGDPRFIVPLEEMVSRYGRDALEMFDDEAKRAARGTTTADRERLAWALMTRVIILDGLERKTDRDTALKAFIDQFRDDPSPTTAQMVVEAQEMLRQLHEPG
jgi:tetratricopeptide (TPR) repeat protein